MLVFWSLKKYCWYWLSDTSLQCNLGRLAGKESSHCSVTSSEMSRKFCRCFLLWSDLMMFLTLQNYFNLFLAFHCCSIRAPYLSPCYPIDKALGPLQPPVEAIAPPWQGRSIAGPKLRLVEFSAFVEQPQEGEMVNLDHNFPVCSFITILLKS